METTTYAYAALAAAAAAALAYYLRKRGAAQDALAAPGSAFAKYGDKVRLRDLYRLAVMLEEKGEELYLKLAAKTSSQDIKKLCAWLAGQEVLHRQFAQDRLDRWRPLPPHLTEWPAFLSKVDQENFFGNPPGDDASEEQLAAFAIRQEIKSAEFYAKFEGSFPEAWKRERMQRLVEEERRHEKALREAYPQVK